MRVLQTVGTADFVRFHVDEELGGCQLSTG